MEPAKPSVPAPAQWTSEGTNVEITPVAAPISSGAPQLASSPPAQRARAGIIEIDLGGGCRVRVDRDVDVEALQQVLELLRRR